MTETRSEKASWVWRVAVTDKGFRGAIKTNVGLDRTIQKSNNVMEVEARHYALKSEYHGSILNVH